MKGSEVHRVSATTSSRSSGSSPITAAAVICLYVLYAKHANLVTTAWSLQAVVVTSNRNLFDIQNRRPAGALFASSTSGGGGQRKRQPKSSSSDASSSGSSDTSPPPSSSSSGGQEQQPSRPRGQRPSMEKMMEIIITGGGGVGMSQRPGAIIETEEQLQRKEEILTEISTGIRQYPDWMVDYGEEEADAAEYDSDDPTALDASTLGIWNILDLKSKFDYEYDPESGEPDPNIPPPGEYVTQVAVDDEGVEIGYDPMYGPSNTIDTRTMIGAKDSYMIDPDTRDESLLTKEFHDGDMEVAYNEDVVQFRQSLKFIETYIDPFLGDDLPVPRHVAKWCGYPEPMFYPRKDYSNNRFTKPQDVTNFDAMTPTRARQRAVELARAKNAEWLPDGVSQAWHQQQRQPYDNVGTRVGTIQTGPCDAAIVEQIQPALAVLGSIVELLSIEQDATHNILIFRFYYHGLIKNKYGMACWAETLIRDCGVDVTNVIFETGFRKRDPAYDGGNPWYSPIF